MLKAFVMEIRLFGTFSLHSQAEHTGEREESAAVVVGNTQDGCLAGDARQIAFNRYTP